MRKTVCISFITLLVLSLLGSCSQKPSDSPSALIDAIVSEAAEQNVAVPETTRPEQTVSELSGNGDPSVDIDLTVMNSNMIYSVIYDLMINADDYYGKTLMVDGYFDTMVNEQLDTRYYFVVVPDAAACCVQGLEFMLDASKVYPDDYPEVSSDIRVKGVIDSYEENGQKYCYIRAEDVEML